MKKLAIIYQQLLSVFLFFCLILFVAFLLTNIFAFPVETFDSMELMPAIKTMPLITQRDILKRDNKVVLLVGSSNVQEGFRPAVLQQKLPGYQVHNFAISAANMLTMDYGIQLLIEGIPPENRKDTVFVVGIWYASMCEEKYYDGLLLPQMEKLHIYSLHGNDIQSSIPQEWQPYYFRLMSPYIAINDFFSGTIKEVVDVYKKDQRDEAYQQLVETAAEPPDVVNSYRQEGIEFWHDYMGAEDDRLSDEQFQVLMDVVQRISDSGSTLILVNMPLPEWHQVQSPYNIQFQEMKEDYLQQAMDYPDVFYVDLQYLNDNLYFRDTAHPSEAAAEKWSKILGEEISKILIKQDFTR